MTALPWPSALADQGDEIFLATAMAGLAIPGWRFSLPPTRRISRSRSGTGCDRPDALGVPGGFTAIAAAPFTSILSENPSTDIPIGVRLRPENPGKLDFQMQSGGYLGEDEIVRFEDVYGRSEGPRQSRRPVGT